MIKIDEKLDLSKQVLEINIDSPVFNCLRQDLNKEIQRCIHQIYDEKFEAGEISIKLNLEILDAYKSIPRKDEFGEVVNDTFKYRKPKFEHKITTTLKQRFKQEGVFTGEREVVWQDGEFITVPIKDPQMTFDDLYTDVKIITHEKASEIIDTREPIGLFIVEEEFGFTGIDNRTGDAWTEDFKDRQKCIDWLNDGDEEE